MTTQEPEDPRERGLRRVKRFYSISAEREWNRLEHPTQGALEFAINKAWIARHLPRHPARVLDIGGGPGRYSIWLAEQGYRVTLADLSPDLLAIAREKSTEAGVQLESVMEANATHLEEIPDASFDAVLCLGPMYHLLEEPDRDSVARELFRVTREGGVVFVAFLNKLSALRAAVDQDVPFFTPYTFDIVKKWHYEGVQDFPLPGVFSPAHCIHPREVPPFLESAGFETIALVSSQSIAADKQAHLALFKERQPELYEWMMQELVNLADDPMIVGASWHILYIGRKP